MTKLAEHIFLQLEFLLREQWDEGERVCKSEQWYCDKLNVSRTPVRQAFNHLSERGYIEKVNRKQTMIREPRENDVTDITGPRSKSEAFEDYFMDFISSGKLVPGEFFSELELTRLSGCNIGAVREILQKMSSYGIVKKNPRKQWEMISFTPETIIHIADIRILFELRAIKVISHDFEKHRDVIEALYKKHMAMKELDKVDSRDFRTLDKDFHRALFTACDNPLIMSQFHIVSLLIHHGITDTRGTKALKLALQGHISVLKALLDQDWRKARVKLKAHLYHYSEGRR
ncbi:MAG: GntR family transcriptional regulator [Lentisphaeria bacterium]|nr:GntR family transcriptional regulator [Lentisphaeria bacterium]